MLKIIFLGIKCKWLPSKIKELFAARICALSIILLNMKITYSCLFAYILQYCMLLPIKSKLHYMIFMYVKKF